MQPRLFKADYSVRGIFQCKSRSFFNYHFLFMVDFNFENILTLVKFGVFVRIVVWQFLVAIGFF